MAVALDELAAFREFKEEVLPFLREAIEKGWSREQIDAHPKIQAMLAARQISIALTEKDSAKALAAIRDQRDRTQGKPTEKKEVEHRYAKLKDEELDSLLISEARSLKSDAAEADDDDIH